MGVALLTPFRDARVPDALRNPAFAALGASLGSGVGPGFLSDLARWPVSLALLLATVAATCAGGVWLMRRVFGAGPETALLATAPGALSYALELARGGPADERAVTVQQSLRLFLIVVLLPPFLAFGAGGAAPAPAAAMGRAASLALLAGALAAGGALGRVGMPAGWLLGGIAVSAVAHVAGWAEGRPAPALTLAALLIVGASAGARFAGITGAELRRFAAAGLAATALAVGIAAAGAALAARATGLPFAELWTAYAPGGIEAMAAIALATGHDPVFVATHHLARILALIAAMPLVLRALRRA